MLKEEQSTIAAPTLAVVLNWRDTLGK